jgi:hypothetical protein
MGLAFDDWDLNYYTKLFKDMGRDPTNVELFDIAQSNSVRAPPAFWGAQGWGTGGRGREGGRGAAPPMWSSSTSRSPTRWVLGAARCQTPR